MEKKINVKKREKSNNQNLLKIFAGLVVVFMISAVIDDPAGFIKGVIDCFK